MNSGIACLAYLNIGIAYLASWSSDWLDALWASLSGVRSSVTFVRLNVIGHCWGGMFNCPASTCWLIDCALAHMQDIWWTRMSVEWRREVLFQQPDLSGLEGWSDENQAAAYGLLAEYHEIFSLKSGELGCTDLAKQQIRVVDDEPFKERFQRIPTPMVDEVYAQIKQMLEAGAIHPNQSSWCNAVVLVHKEEGGL